MEQVVFEEVWASVEQTAGSIHRLRFEVYEIDFELGELRKDGHKVGLQEQPFQILVQLLLHPGKLVTREELQKRLWPADTFVDFDLGLNTAIKKIRAALGDSAENPRFIETLPKRGYRFIGKVEVIPPPEQAVAVQPAEPALLASHLGTPLAEGAPKVLGSVAPPARVHNRTWLVWSFSAVILALLGLGSVWLHYRNRQPVQSIAEERLEDRGTRVPAAYESYLRGIGFWHGYDMPQRNDNAIQAFEQAVRADPSYSIAYASLSEAYWSKFQTTRQDEWADQAIKACNRAHELDSNQPAAYICQGVLDQGRGEYQRAIDDFSVAIELGSRNALAYRSRALAFEVQGSSGEAERDLLRSIELEPSYWRGYSMLGRLYMNLARYGEAIQQYQRAIDITPDNSEPRFSMGAVYVETGQYDKAAAVLEDATRLHPSLAAYNNLGIVSLNARRFEAAVRSLQKATELDPNDYRGYGNLARAYYWAGRKDLAHTMYLRAIDLARQALTANPDNADATLSLAVYYAMLSQADDAIYYLDRALKSQTEPEAAFWAAVVHLQLGDQAKALAWIRKARQLKYSAAEINAVPELDSLRNTPEFKTVMLAGSNANAIDTAFNRRGK